MSNLFTKLQSHIFVYKKECKHYTNILKVIDKYGDKVYYKHFYQIVIKLNNFFYNISIIM